MPAKTEQRFSLKDHLFNENSLGDLAAEYAVGIAGFDGDGFLKQALSGLAGRELLQRLEWIADCIEHRLSDDFDTMAAQLESAMLPALDPTLTDDDFGRFIHAIPGILAVRHGLENHRDRALDLLYCATQRFSMEFYIRPFLNRWPDHTMARLSVWAQDSNYHVRRLVSEGTRPKLPWAKAITLDPKTPLPLLDKLHVDSTRYVTRSVANHMNDIAKIDPDGVVGLLEKWQSEGRQTQKELDWMTRHSLRTLVKQGHTGALSLLGYHSDAPVSLAEIYLAKKVVKIGDVLEFSVTLKTDSETPLPVLVDYVVTFQRSKGTATKVFKLRQGTVSRATPLTLLKRHPLKGNATTFTLHPGVHKVSIQVNGKLLDDADFMLEAP